MQSEMTAREIDEWRVRALLDSDVRATMNKGMSFSEAHALVFGKYQRK